MYRSIQTMEDDGYLRQRIRDILNAQIREQHEGGVLLGDGYGTHKGALKGWKTRREHEMMGMGYGTHKGALKAARTKRMHKLDRGVGVGGAKGHSNWINFVKNYANQHGVSYKEALIEAGPAYHQMVGHGIAVGGVRKRRAPKRKARKLRKPRASGYYLY